MTPQEIKDAGIEHLILRDAEQDFKVAYVQGRFFHREKQYFIPRDEPVYTVRAGDPTALVLIKAYNEALHAEDATQIVVDHRATSSKMYDLVRSWQEANVDKWFVEGVIGKNVHPAAKLFLADLITIDALRYSTGLQDLLHIPYNYRLWDTLTCEFIPEDEPVITFRGKDALLVKIIDKHNELLQEFLEQLQYAGCVAPDDELDRLVTYVTDFIDLNESRKDAVIKFHKENPTRVGVTCALEQKPQGNWYAEALKDN